MTSKRSKNQDWMACADTLADDVVVHQGGRTHHGIELFITHWKNYYDAIPDACIHIDDILAEGDQVAARITNTGTNEEELPSIDSTGTKIEFSSQLIAKIEDRTITELWIVAEPPRPTSE
ncbi:MAG: ester cyclase [Halobacteriaceae archaeon]